jgi:WD40 repeat protein
VYLFAVPANIKNLGSPSKSELGAFAASGKTIWSVHFESNKTLIAGGADGTVRFWGVPSGSNFDLITPAKTIATHSGLVASIAYSASLGLLATASPSSSHVWQTSPAVVATSICQSLKAPVRRTVWTDYLPGVAYDPVCG